MSTVSAAFARLPAWARSRYLDTSHAVNWVNELLQDISAIPGALKELKKEIGVPVSNNIWITMPADCRTLVAALDPPGYDGSYRWEIVNGLIRLTEGVEIPDNDTPDTVDEFDNSTVDYIDVNIADAVENDYENYLLYITAGTSSGVGIMLSGNDASDTGTCRLYFYQPLQTALGTLAITEAQLLQNYIRLQYNSGFPEVSSVSDEIPINDRFERALVDKYMLYRIWKGIDESLPAARTALSEYNSAKSSIKREGRTVDGGIKLPPRQSPGFSQLLRR